MIFHNENEQSKCSSVCIAIKLVFDQLQLRISYYFACKIHGSYQSNAMTEVQFSEILLSVKSSVMRYVYCGDTWHTTGSMMLRNLTVFFYNSTTTTTITSI